MRKQCLDSGCSKRAIYSCGCTDPKMHFCDDHYSRHLRTPGSHLPECMIVELTPEQRNQILPKLTNLILYLQKCEKDAIRTSEEFIERIMKYTSKTLNNLQELEIAAFDIMSGRSIEKDYYERITNFSIEGDNQVSNSIENIKRDLEKALRFDDFEDISWKECNEVIFSRDSTVGDMLSIDLNTFKLSNLHFAPKIGAYSTACKIDKDLYFFQGGYINGFKGESYIINIKEKKYEKFNNGNAYCHRGSALKDNTVYIFGGHNGSSVNVCEAFDLKTKNWKSIHALPKASNSVTAALLDKEIILSGYDMNCCYSYKGSTFTSILHLSVGFKIVCEGWILANSVLYGYKENNQPKWIMHNADGSFLAQLCTYCVFKKEHFFYFICSIDSSLMRIDTKLKKLDKMPYN